VRRLHPTVLDALPFAPTAPHSNYERYELMRNIALAVTLLLLSGESIALAQAPAKIGPVLPFGQQAAQIRSMDILARPYRPGHVYGNTVRRMHRRAVNG
jgi:hypothetical protein